MVRIGRSIVSFPFQKYNSPLFTTIYQPIAFAEIQSSKTKKWVGVWGIVDTGADYILLPKDHLQKLEVDLEKDCETTPTFGVGGEEKSYLLRKAKIRLGFWDRIAPIGFLDRDDVPPLFGRQEFLETFTLTFKNHKTIFEG